MLLMMLEKDEPIHSIVFCDTGWEFPDMLKHIDRVEKCIDREIVRLYISLPTAFARYGWPNPTFRNCTGLKRDALAKYHGKFKPYISCRGLSKDENNRTMKGIKKLHKGCSVRFPLIERGMSEKDCLEYCYEHGFNWNGLYEHFHRVSCWCCPFQSLPELRNLRKHYPEKWKELKKMDIASTKLGYSFKQNKTIIDIEKRFQNEDKQVKLFF